jgi:hypothetical protein
MDATKSLCARLQRYATDGLLAPADVCGGWPFLVQSPLCRLKPLAEIEFDLMDARNDTDRPALQKVSQRPAGT